MKSKLLTAFALSLLSVACTSPSPLASVAEPRTISDAVQQSPLERAEALFKQQQWADALALYRSEFAARPQDVHVLNRVAHCEHLLGRYDASLAAWTEMAALRPQDPTTRYNVACANAKLGLADAAFAALDDALARGFRDAQTLAGDADLEALRADPRFASVAQRVQAAASGPRPPPPAAEQFAFWVGEWDVFAPSGGRAGSSHIERILGGYVILENWSGADGMNGKSFNTYDPAKQRWRQHWVDDRGGVLDFGDGQFADGVLTLHSAWTQPDGTKRQRRLSFTDLGDDGVRQYSEWSSDGGASWTNEYELFYRRKESK
jgi:tetratricopeptide (TPR) repeat protein